MPRAVPKDLLVSLAKSIGHESATLELRWMKEVARDSAHLQTMVSRRVQGEPLQYILGTQPFGPLNLLTRRPVLIPRPETEDWALRLSELIRPTAHKPISLLDLCTGSGCIPLLLCHLWPSGSVRAVGVDVSEDAICLATDNARLCGADIPPISDASAAGAAESVSKKRNTFFPLLANIRDPGFVLSSALRPPFHVITSNPPYILPKDYCTLPTSVRNFEDPRALIGDPAGTTSGKGLTFYHDISRMAAREDFLTEDGIVAVEVGVGQAEVVAEIFTTQGQLRRTEIWKDPWDIQRVVIGRR